MIRSIAKRQGKKRSTLWPIIRRRHLRRESACQMCGGTQKLQVHHIRPFHVHPELELADENLITLCEKRGHDCHFVIGHFHNWAKWNPHVRSDSTAYFKAQEEAPGG